MPDVPQPPAHPPPEEPSRPESAARERKPFLLRVSPQLMDELRGWAEQDMRSLNGHIEWLLTQAVRKRKGKG